MPDVIADKVRDYAVNDFSNQYEAYNTAVASNQLDQAKTLRDRMVFQLKRNIDANYADFENNVFLGKASSNVLFDITELGAVFAGTITNGERAKTIIAAALSAFKGGRKSIDVNFFREKTTESLIQTMRASRSRSLEKINIGLRNKVADYTLEEALGHLIDYFYAGSLSNALVELSKQASEQAAAAKTDADREEKLRLRANLVHSVTINELRNDLYFKITKGADADKAEARAKLIRVLGALKAALPDLKVTFAADTSTNDELFTELQRVLEAAARLDTIPTETILNALQTK
jgi:hypothetical protein